MNPHQLSLAKQSSLKVEKWCLKGAKSSNIVHLYTKSDVRAIIRHIRFFYSFAQKCHHVRAVHEIYLSIKIMYNVIT